MDEGIQNSFFNQVRKDRTRVTVVLTSGQRISGQVKAFDKFTLLVDTKGGDQMIFKHAISTVSVHRPSEGRSEGRAGTGSAGKEKQGDPRNRFGNFISFDKKSE